MRIYFTFLINQTFPHITFPQELSLDAHWSFVLNPDLKNRNGRGKYLFKSLVERKSLKKSLTLVVSEMKLIKVSLNTDKKRYHLSLKLRSDWLNISLNNKNNFCRTLRTFDHTVESCWVMFSRVVSCPVKFGPTFYETNPKWFNISFVFRDVECCLVRLTTRGTFT